MINSKPIGITFSHLHLEYLKLDVDQALDKALSFKFSHIRLGCYWSEIEIQKNKYNFSKIKQFLKKCENNNQPVIVTVGVKAPRWPEFYWPKYIDQQTLNHQETQKRIILFLKEAIKELKNFSCIDYWQIENEPLDPSGPNNLIIPLEFLKKEIEVIKKSDQRKIIINFWGNDLLIRKLVPKIEDKTDFIGLDLYPKQFVKKILGKNIYKNYLGLHQPKKQLIKTISKFNKPAIITELQAEPWEANETEYLSKKTTSISPQQLEKNILEATKLPITEILLWGFEYWLWQEKNNNQDYLDIIRKFT